MVDWMISINVRREGQFELRLKVNIWNRLSLSIKLLIQKLTQISSHHHAPHLLMTSTRQVKLDFESKISERNRSPE